MLSVFLARGSWVCAHCNSCLRNWRIPWCCKSLLKLICSLSIKRLVIVGHAQFSIADEACWLHLLYGTTGLGKQARTMGWLFWIGWFEQSSPWLLYQWVRTPGNSSSQYQIEQEKFTNKQTNMTFYVHSLNWSMLTKPQSLIQHIHLCHGWLWTTNHFKRLVIAFKIKGETMFFFLTLWLVFGEQNYQNFVMYVCNAYGSNQLPEACRNLNHSVETQSTFNSSVEKLSYSHQVCYASQ